MDSDRRLFGNKALVALIVPLFLEQLLSILVGMADSVMIARVGEAAVSGVSLVDNTMVLIIQLFGALSAGGAVVAGQYLGQRHNSEACRSIYQMMLSVIALSVGVMIIVYIVKGFILKVVFGEISASVEENARTYLLIVTASIPFIALYNWGAAAFRAMGDSRTSMIVSLIMNVVNVSGNAILIFGLHMGTAGVAIPTLVSRMVAALIMIALLRNQKRLLHIPSNIDLKPDFPMIKRILRIGIPSGLENSMFQLGKIIVLSLVSSFGTSAIAANAVAGAVATFQTISGSTISLAMVTVVSRCVGAGDYKQAKYYAKKLLAIEYISLLIINAGLWFARSGIMWIYDLKNETADITESLFNLYAVSAVLIWALSFTLPNVFRAAGDVKFSMIVSTASMWLFRIVGSYVLGGYMKMGVYGVWVAMIIDWGVRTAAFVPHFLRNKWTAFRVS